MRVNKILRIRDILKDNYKAFGIKFFYAGFSACMVRAYVVNFPLMPLFELLNLYMEPYCYE